MNRVDIRMWCYHTGPVTLMWCSICGPFGVAEGFADESMIKNHLKLHKEQP